MERIVEIIGVPMDLGQARRGVDMGPSAVRYAGLAYAIEKTGCRVIDAGNVQVAVMENLASKDVTSVARAIGEACTAVYHKARAACANGHFPIFLGGDHSIAIGTVGGITHDESCGVIWVDAHGDFNIPATSPNGNIHGMPVAVLVGRGMPELVDVGRPGPKIAPADIVLFGTRDLDYDERSMLRDSSIKVCTIQDIDEHGIGTVARRALETLNHCRRIHVSFDMDILDPGEAPGVGTPASGGLTFREAHLLMEILAASGKIGSMDIVEINPILDCRNQTAKLAVDMATSLLGKRIF